MTRTLIPLLLNSFDLPSYSSELRKRYMLRLSLMCLEALEGGFSCFPGRDWKGARRKLSLVKLNQWIWMWNLYQNLILALLIVAVCTVLFWKLYMILRKNEPTTKELCNLFLQNIKNEIFQILKALENNMKFTKEAFWINSKISNRGKNTTLIF